MCAQAKRHSQVVADLEMAFENVEDGGTLKLDTHYRSPSARWVFNGKYTLLGAAACYLCCAARCVVQHGVSCSTVWRAARCGVQHGVASSTVCRAARCGVQHDVRCC